jgi:hypothetical protein
MGKEPLTSNYNSLHDIKRFKKIYKIDMKNMNFRAILYNLGFVEAMKMKAWDCFIFHDVDHYPEDLR